MIIFTNKQFKKFNDELRDYFRYTDRDFIYWQNEYIKKLEKRIDNALKFIKDNDFVDLQATMLKDILKGNKQ